MGHTLEKLVWIVALDDDDRVTGRPRRTLVDPALQEVAIEVCVLDDVVVEVQLRGSPERIGEGLSGRDGVEVECVQFRPTHLLGDLCRLVKQSLSDAAAPVRRVDPDPGIQDVRARSVVGVAHRELGNDRLSVVGDDEASADLAGGVGEEHILLGGQIDVPGLALAAQAVVERDEPRKVIVGQIVDLDLGEGVAVFGEVHENLGR